MVAGSNEVLASNMPSAESINELAVKMKDSSARVAGSTFCDDVTRFLFLVPLTTQLRSQLQRPRFPACFPRGCRTLKTLFIP
jgi:hypothetical protein